MNTGYKICQVCWQGAFINKLKKIQCNSFSISIIFKEIKVDSKLYNLNDLSYNLNQEKYVIWIKMFYRVFLSHFSLPLLEYGFIINILKRVMVKPATRENQVPHSHLPPMMMITNHIWKNSCIYSFHFRVLIDKVQLLFTELLYWWK